MILRRKKFLVTIQVQKPQTPYSLTPKILKKRGMKENQEIQREDIFEKVKYVIITSESACSSDLSYHQSFQPHYRIFSSSGGYKEMVTAYFRAYVS